MGRRRPFKRTDRLASQLRQALATAITFETREDLLRQVMLTEVSVTSDLSVARIYYYTMDGNTPEVAKALRRANGFLRGKVAEAIRARHTPELRFIYDDTVERGTRVEAILSELGVRDTDADVAAVEEE